MCVVASEQAWTGRCLRRQRTEEFCPCAAFDLAPARGYVYPGGGGDRRRADGRARSGDELSTIAPPAAPVRLVRAAYRQRLQDPNDELGGNTDEATADRTKLHSSQTAPDLTAEMLPSPKSTRSRSKTLSGHSRSRRASLMSEQHMENFNVSLKARAVSPNSSHDEKSTGGENEGAGNKKVRLHNTLSNTN